MKAVMVMFDSLNRRLLPPYGCDWTQAPNFKRLAEKSTTFDSAYIGSMPCMPARREFHTSRTNFLHCGWGPLEPFDQSFVSQLKKAGVHTHLTTDHYHYFENGGTGYNTCYNTWEFFRGQEGDPWIGQVEDPVPPDNINKTLPHAPQLKRQDWINRKQVNTDEDHWQTRTFQSGIDFINRNQAADNWFLHIECFDPHEPFFSGQDYLNNYPTDYDGPLFDWPSGRHGVVETPEQIEEGIRRYAALLTKCDASLGRILDTFDQHNLWEDTLLILWTDHGYLLTEHNCWAKCSSPFYQEIANTPFFIYDPRHPNTAGQRRQSLVQPSMDLAPTLLDFFGLETPDTMLGHNLKPVIESDASVRKGALFGMFGSQPISHVNITDGRYVYMRDAVAKHLYPINAYTLQPRYAKQLEYLSNLEKVELVSGSAYSNGVPLLKIPGDKKEEETPAEHLLFDLENDPQQKQPCKDEATEAKMCELMREMMQACDAPRERFLRIGLE